MKQKPTLEQLIASRDAFLEKIEDLDDKALADAWVMAKCHIEKFKPTSEEAKMLIAFQRKLDKIRKERKPKRTTPTLNALQQEIADRKEEKEEVCVDNKMDSLP